MAYFVADEKLQGYYVSGGVTINIIKYHFECDDAASLPAQGAFISSKNVKISMASTAHTIDTDALYKMDSSGAWVKQSQPWQPLADYSVLSNKPQINGHTLTGNQSGADLGLQNVLTFDAAPKQNSTNPVTSGGIWADQQRQETEIGVVANAGAKNLLNFDAWKDVGVTRCTKTISGNSITINSTGNDSFTWYIAESTTVQYPVAARITVEAGKTYRLSWTANNNNKLNHAIYGNGTTGRPDNVIYRGEGSGYLDYTAASDVTFITFRLGLYDSGNTTTFSNVMIRPAAITDPTFQPYAKTNPELTVLTDEDRAALVELVDGGAKNLITYTKIGTSVTSGTSYTHQGVTFTMLSDGSVSATRNSSGTDTAFCNLRLDASSFFIDDYCDGNHVLSGCPSDGDTNGFDIRATNNTYNAVDTGQGVILSDRGSQSSIWVQIRISKNCSPDNLIFKPMICTKSAWKISQTFQPYRPSWQEMYEMILALQ